MQTKVILKKSGASLIAVTIWLSGLLLLLALSGAYITYKVPASLGAGKHIFTDLWDKGYFSAAGSWTGKDLSPLQVSEIRCDRDEELCTEALATLQKSFFGNDHYLNVSLERYRITRWDEDFITYERGYECHKYRYTIDKKNKSVAGLRSLIKGSKCDSEESYSSGDIELTLADSFPVYWEEQQKAVHDAVPFLLLALFIWTWVIIKRSYRKIKAL